jgi:hypothetical protein
MTLLDRIHQESERRNALTIAPKSFDHAAPGEIFYFGNQGNFVVGQRAEQTNLFLFIAECRTAEIAVTLIRALRSKSPCPTLP